MRSSRHPPRERPSRPGSVATTPHCSSTDSAGRADPAPPTDPHRIRQHADRPPGHSAHQSRLNLPSDGRVDGYDKVSAALPMSAASAAGYLRMSEDLLRWVLRPMSKPEAAADPVSGGLDPAHSSSEARPERAVGWAHVCNTADGAKVSFNTTPHPARQVHSGARIPGIHHLRICAYGYQTEKPTPVGIYVGHTGAYPQIIELVKVVEIPVGRPARDRADVYLRTGRRERPRRRFGQHPPHPLWPGVSRSPRTRRRSQCRGPGLALQWIDVEEPEAAAPWRSVGDGGPSAGNGATNSGPEGDPQSANGSRPARAKLPGRSSWLRCRPRSSDSARSSIAAI